MSTVQKSKQNKAKNMEPSNLWTNFLLQNSVNPVCAVLRHFSCVQLFAIPWTIACQAPLSMGFSRQEYGVGCHSFSRGSSRPRDQIQFTCTGFNPLQEDFLPSESRKTHLLEKESNIASCMKSSWFFGRIKPFPFCLPTLSQQT